ncbi:hypothetical protein NKJ35_17490 [Mesorhizobium sp. M0136]|uniref:hypothetical protein n=1 Tax=Mesorhizobium sp. M0136 TaxID=2956890 RepID=UPI00333B6C2D
MRKRSSDHPQVSFAALDFVDDQIGPLLRESGRSNQPRTSLILVNLTRACQIVEPLAGVLYNNHQGHQIKQEVVGRLGGCS